MSKKFTYSRTIHTYKGAEAFTAVEFDSFDEAKKIVDKGIKDRVLELNQEQSQAPVSSPGMPFPLEKKLAKPNSSIGSDMAVTQPVMPEGQNVMPEGQKFPGHGVSNTK